MADEIIDEKEVVDDKKDEVVDDKKDEKEEVDPEQEEKDNLWNMLKNPKTARAVIQSLAEEAGLFGDKTTKQVKNSVIETLEEELGDDFKFLGPRIGKALERILAERDSKVDEKFRENSQKEIQRETDSAVEKIKGEFKDFNLFENKIVKLMKEIAPSNNLSQYSYLKRLYTIAKAESSSSRDTRPNEKKRDGVLSKLNSKPPVGGEHKETSSRPISRRAAIEEAFAELSSEE